MIWWYPCAAGADGELKVMAFAGIAAAAAATAADDDDDNDNSVMCHQSKQLIVASWFMDANFRHLCGHSVSIYNLRNSIAAHTAAFTIDADDTLTIFIQYYIYLYIFFFYSQLKFCANKNKCHSWLLLLLSLLLLRELRMLRTRTLKRPVYSTTALHVVNYTRTQTAAEWAASDRGVHCT